jgi:hypothetical protein
MRYIRVAAKQAHPVPIRATSPQGPFPPDLYFRAPIVTDYVSQPDGGGDEVPEGATPQNNMQGPLWYRCRDCQERVAENRLDEHMCIGEMLDG